MRPAQNQSASNELSIADQLQALTSRIDALYGTKIDDISQTLKDGIANKFNEVNDQGPRAQEFVGLLQEILDERERVTKARKEILEKKIFKHLLQKTPQKISVKQELQENRSVATPTEFELRNIMLESAKAQDLIDMNQQRLKTLLTEGRDLSDEQKHKLSNLRTGSDTYAQAISRTAENLGGSAARIGSKALNQIGRGIFSKGEAGKSSFVDEYRKILDERIKNLKSSIDPKKSKYAKVLEKMATSLKSSQDPMEIASCDSLCQLIQNEIETENKEYKDAIDKFDKEVSDLTKEMMGKVQADIDKSDEQWKYRAMSMFLIFTPLGAFSIAGQVFNYLDPLVEIFGPIFEANKSLGEGFADAITSKQFGFLGQLMDKMEIDKAVETIIDKTPILSNFTEILNSLMDSEIAQNAGGQLAPMLDSPLTLVAIAASFSISRAPAELDLMKSKRDNKMKYLGGTEVRAFPTEKGFFKVKESALDEKFESFKNSFSKSDSKKDKISKLVDSELAVLENSYIDCRAAKFFADSARFGELLPILTRISPNLLQQYQQGNINDENGLCDFKAVLRYLNQNQQAKKDFREAFLTVAAIDNNIVTNGAMQIGVQQVADSFDDLNQPDNPQKNIEKENKQKEAAKLLKKEFYFDDYRANGGKILSRDDNEVKKAKDVTRSNRIEFYSDNMKMEEPSSSIRPTTAMLLQRNQQRAVGI